MKHFFNTIICIFFATIVYCQDTTVVQTFTWDSDTRRADFTFPDDPTKTYRKIFMRYHMRCHDAAVGNGAVGCREWDYSCNTFLTDPNQKDSLLATHPSHIIPGVTDGFFEYISYPLYDYYVDELYDIDLTPIEDIQLQVGAGEETMKGPQSGAVNRLQFIYHAEELLAAGMTAGNIHALDLDLLEVDGNARFFKLKMANTSDSTFTGSFLQSALSEVYYNHSSLSEGINTFNFYEAFEWDGASNLLIELSYTDAENTPSYSFKANATNLLSSVQSQTENHSMVCNGSSSFQIPTEKLASIKDAVSVSFWSKGDEANLPSNTYIFNAQDANNGRQVSSHLPWSNGQLYWDCAGERVNAQATESQYEGQWNHYAFVKDAITGEQTIYVNGEVFVTANDRNASIEPLTRFIVGNIWSFDRPYFGLVDEFAVWDVALSQENIQNLMAENINSENPNYTNLLSYYTFEEGEGTDLNDQSDQGNHTQMNAPAWHKMSGEEIFLNADKQALRPNVIFRQGTVEIQSTSITEMDSVLQKQYEIISYGLDGTDIVELNRMNVFSFGYSYVFDADGNKIDSTYHSAEGGVAVEDLEYYLKSDARYELLSLVTPYGNGLDLGPEGKVFMFDMTDFTPILKGEKTLSIEYGGEWQEELDIQFIYIEGMPERPVMDVQNVWPMRRAWFDELQSDRYFEPRVIQTTPNASFYELKSSITGHGQNGEFQPREHYINVNDGTQEFKFTVWKECAFNPIFPQGGTWIFDRAGWCPGMQTDIHRFDLTSYVNEDGSLPIDYGVNGGTLSEANYLASHQVVSYGAYTHNLDASLEDVIRPNNERVEFERLNPACNTPTITVRNSGASDITSLQIAYGVRGNEAEIFDWTGTIVPAESRVLEMPVFESAFWNIPDGEENMFDVNILAVNGEKDDYDQNDFISSPFDTVEVFEFEGTINLTISTNFEADDNSYTIKDAGGNVVMERDNMENSTKYNDLLNFASGCYSLDFVDTANDGLSFWFYPGNGTGFMRFSEDFNGIDLPIRTFESDNGAGIKYDFVIQNDLVPNDDFQFERLSTFPNPAQDDLFIELEGFKNDQYILQILDLQGRLIMQKQLEGIQTESSLHNVDVNSLEVGMYILRLDDGKKVWTTKLEIIR